MLPLKGRTILYLVTEDWYFWSHRLPVARAARDAGARVVVASNFDRHRDRILGEGFETVPVPFDRSGLNPFRDAGTLAAIVSAYRRIRPDIVHQVAVKPVLYGTLAAWLTGRHAVINAMAGLGFLFTGGGARARLLRAPFALALRLLDRATSARTIVQNPDDRAALVAAGLDPGRIVLIPGSGIDTAAFTPQPEPGEGPVVAVCVSRMLWDKGIGELVEAARLLRQRGAPVLVRLVGGTDSNPARIEPAQLDAWQREGIVEIAGHRTDIAAEYAGAHIAVLPSYREGLPKSLLEAAACGRPIIATDVPGCREICIASETGLLVPPRDPAALAAAIATLAADQALRHAFGRKARHLAETRFDQSLIAAQTLALYRRSLGMPGGT
ncbi:MAG: glycosyltransferase family 4 protein [Rhabdaerophilum calidifontis]